jgi:hypothetical protein
MALPAVLVPGDGGGGQDRGRAGQCRVRGEPLLGQPGHDRDRVTLRHRLGTATMEVFSPAGQLIVAHRLAPPGAAMMVRTAEHRASLEAVVLSQFSTARPCDRKANKPPGTAALAERARLLGADGAKPTVALAAISDIVRLAFPGTTNADTEVPA